MSVANPSKEPFVPGGGPRTALDLTVSRYDRVASLLVALLVLIGTAVLVMFIIWLTTQLVWTAKAVPVEYIEYEGRGDHAEGFERDMEPPGLEELEEIREPALETSLEAVTSALSTQAAALDSVDVTSKVMGKGGGLGDSRRPGPEGEGRNVVPPWERWEIRYVTSSVQVYAQQLDSFDIELAAAGGAPKIDYAKNLAGTPQTRQGESKDEKRIYMTWKSGKLADFDRQLLQKAGIRTQNRVVMQFYSQELVRAMEAKEFANANGRPPEEWRKTIFGVRRQGNRYEFYVIDQFFRPPPK